MSRSVSAPSSVTKTSPCWNGFIVPGSTLRYGSSFCMTTRRPRAVSRLPRLAAVRPLPREETTPPVTKMCLVIRAVRSDAGPWSEVFATGFHAIRIVTCRTSTRARRERTVGRTDGCRPSGNSALGPRELARVSEAALAVGQAAQQARHLGDALLPVELLHARGGHLAVVALDDPQVV